MDPQAAFSSHPCLHHDGDVAARMRAYDWSATSLGPPEAWPRSLRTIVSLMLASKFPMFVAWGPDLTFLYNDAYAPIFGAKHPLGLAQPFREVWSEIWDDVGPLAQRALEGESVYLEDLPLLMRRKGFDEQTYFTFSYSPARDDNDEVAGVFCACTETTGEVMARDALREEKEHLTELFRQAPGFMCVVRGPEHVFEVTNDAYRQVVGYRDLIGKKVREALPDLEGQGFYELLDRVYQTGEAFVGRQVQIELQPSPHGPRQQAFLDFVYQPIRDANGKVTGIFVEGLDATDRARSQARQQLLINELNHRVKNTLATVQAIASQSFRPGEDTQQARELFTSRILALANTHNILNREGWDGADLTDIVAEALRPFDHENRVHVKGPQIRLTAKAAVAFALGLHELVTNAVKYGSLSSEAGSIDICWSARAGLEGSSHRLKLAWQEKGGPSVRVPERRGFGSRLLERSLAAELNGTVDLAFEATGLRCEIDVQIEEDGGGSQGREQESN